MYQNNKQLMHPDKGDEAEYCSLPSEETNRDICLDGTYSTSRLGNSLAEAPEAQSPTPEDEFESTDHLGSLMDPTISEPLSDQNETSESAVDKEVIKAHGCHECGKLYSELRSLQRHMKSHGVEGSVDNENNSLRNAGQRASRAGTTPLQCDQCPRQFERRSHYHYHVKIHHGPREFKCQMCEKAFVSRGALTTHARIHSGEKPYECETCGRRFNVNSNLLAHVPKCTGTLPFKCEHCEKAFATRSLYQIHVKVHFIFASSFLQIINSFPLLFVGSSRRICRKMWYLWDGVSAFHYLTSPKLQHV